MRTHVAKRIAVELRWMGERWTDAAASGQTSRSAEVRRMAADWAEQARVFGRLALQITYEQRTALQLGGRWRARLDSQPRRYVGDAVELSGPGISDLIRYVVDQLALVDLDGFREYADAARAVEDANLHGVATDEQVAAAEQAWAALAPVLPPSMRLSLPDARCIAGLLESAANPVSGLREAA